MLGFDILSIIKFYKAINLKQTKGVPSAFEKLLHEVFFL